MALVHQCHFNYLRCVIIDEPKIKPESATIKFWAEWSDEKAKQDITTATTGLRKQSKK